MVSGTAFDFNTYVAGKRAVVEAGLSQFLSGGDPDVLFESMRYSVLSGGKRIRAMLCLSAFEAVDHGIAAHQAETIALPCACAIEMVHAMSLIHDDLPVMDNDDFRRGKPTNHKVFGEATALLAGDALLVRAFETVARFTPECIDRSVVLNVVAELARACGAQGLVAGQVDDLTFTGCTAVDESRLRKIHSRKTGELLSFSAWSGAYLAGARGEMAQRFREFGRELGLAFQIADDLLDATGDMQTLGKTPGKDAQAKKTTWVGLFGIESSRTQLQELKRRLDELLLKTGIDRESLSVLSALSGYAVERVN